MYNSMGLSDTGVIENKCRSRSRITSSMVGNPVAIGQLVINPDYTH